MERDVEMEYMLEFEDKDISMFKIKGTGGHTYEYMGNFKWEIKMEKWGNRNSKTEKYNIWYENFTW